MSFRAGGLPVFPPGSQPSWAGCLRGTSIDFVVLAFFREQSSCVSSLENLQVVIHSGA